MLVSLGTSEAFATDFKDSSGYQPYWAEEQTPERTFYHCETEEWATISQADVISWCKEFVAKQKSELGWTLSEVSESLKHTYKKYTDEKSGFSFEYPDTWYVEELPLEESNSHYLTIDYENISISIFHESANEHREKFDMTGDDGDIMSIAKYERVLCNYGYSMYEDGIDCRDFESGYGEVLEVDGVRTIIVTHTERLVLESGYEQKYFKQTIVFDKNNGIWIRVSQMTTVSYNQRMLNDVEIDKFIRSFTFDKSAIGGGCLIATATYGTELAPQVQLLREIRDNSLLQTESGSAFMSGFNEFYYSFSPTIADYERENPVFKEAVKLAITPMITSLSLMENAETESQVLGIGISLIALNLAMYIGIPAIVIVGIRKRF